MVREGAMLKKVKAVLTVLALGTFLALFLGGTLVMWQTRKSAIAGAYHASGVWGESSLTLNPDHSFTQSVKFMEYDQPIVAPYRRHVVSQRSISGHWEERGRDYFDQTIELRPFISLIKDDRGKQLDRFQTAFGPVGWALGIEIDEGASIVYWK